MSRHDNVTSLRHMLDHAREAVDMMTDRIRADLDTDRMLQLAVVRLLEIVGEAATRVSEPRRTRHPEIAWPKVVGMRNRIIHGYDQVDLNVVWDTIQHDLPPLIASLEAIVTP